MRVFYLHGFASSPASRKAGFFAEKFRELGVTLEIPNLAENNFERLTITGQLKAIERAASSAGREDQEIVLIGSSLGGYLAALYASRHPEVDRIVLLAPAFQFYQLWLAQLGPENLARWKRDGSMTVFHYGEAREVPLGYELMEDAARYEPFPLFSQPALLLHGLQDPVVPIGYSVAFAQAHPNVHLVQLESGHELTDVLDEIWRETKNFLSTSGRKIEC